MKVRDLMTTHVELIEPDASVQDAAALMGELDVSALPIGSSAELKGVITDRDIVCRVVAEGKNPATGTVEHFMSQPIVTVRADEPIEDVVSTMEKHQIRRVPVTDERGSCLGIIAQADVAWIAEEHSVAELVREVSRDSRRAAQ